MNLSSYGDQRDQISLCGRWTDGRDGGENDGLSQSGGLIDSLNFWILKLLESHKQNTRQINRKTMNLSLNSKDRFYVKTNSDKTK